MFRIKILGVLVSDGAWKVARRVTLHSSAFGFGVDFFHVCAGKAMIFAAAFERYRELIISWSAWAAVLVVYIDGHFEAERRRREIRPVEEDVVEEKEAA
jgi:hypothetical protein